MTYESAIDIGPRVCKRPECGLPFDASRRWMEYCSGRCRSRHWYDQNKTEHNARRSAARRARVEK